VLAAPPALALVCLRVVTGAGPAADDTATRQVLEQVNAAGNAFLTHTTVDGRYVIRVAIGSVTTRPEHVDQLWDRLSAEARVVLPPLRSGGSRAFQAARASGRSGPGAARAAGRTSASPRRW
jgi:glutamate/tyrosine decarboxylase-like PLP-dependent enzyme